MDFKTEFKPLTVDPDKIYDYSFSMIAEEMGHMIFQKMNGKLSEVSFMLQQTLN